MKRLWYLTAVVVVASLVGCSTSHTRDSSACFAQVSLGMTKAEVAQLLGPPSQTGTGKIYLAPNSSVSSGFSEIWRYRWRERRQTNDNIVVFVKDQVTEYGPLVGDLERRYGGGFP
jgi:hypothetical protein